MSKEHYNAINLNENEMTEEEKTFIENFFDTIDDDDDDAIPSNNDYEHEIYSDESDFGESEELILDPRFEEYIQHDETVPDVLSTSIEIPTTTVEPNRGQKYTSQGKNNCTVWWSMPCNEEILRTAAAKRERDDSLPVTLSQQFPDKKEAFLTVFPYSMAQTIAMETNKKAKKYNMHQQSENKMTRYWYDTNADEIYAFIAIVLYAGADKSSKVDVTDVFGLSRPPFPRAVMPLYRFEQLTRFIRFDDSRTRAERLRHDKLAPIRHILSWRQ